MFYIFDWAGRLSMTYWNFSPLPPHPWSGMTGSLLALVLFKALHKSREGWCISSGHDGLLWEFDFSVAKKERWKDLGCFLLWLVFQAVPITSGYGAFCTTFPFAGPDSRQARIKEGNALKADSLKPVKFGRMISWGGEEEEAVKVSPAILVVNVEGVHVS